MVSVVDFIIKIVVACAWVWGSLMAMGCVLTAILESGTKRTSELASFVSTGWIAWAVLLARYIL